MKTSDIIQEELNTQYVNKELASLDSIKKQLDAKIAANPMLSKELSGTVAEIDKKVKSLKYAIAEYSKNKAMESKTGVGTQAKIQPGGAEVETNAGTARAVIKAPVNPTDKINPAARTI